MTKCINFGVPNATVVHLLTTPKQVVDHMGGAVRLSIILAIPVNTIYGWLRRESIPIHRLLQVAKLAEKEDRPFDVGAYVEA